MARNYLLARGTGITLRCSFSGFNVHFYCPVYFVLDCPHYITPMLFIQDLCAHFLHVFFTTKSILPLSTIAKKMLFNLQQIPYRSSPSPPSS